MVGRLVSLLNSRPLEAYNHTSSVAKTQHQPDKLTVTKLCFFCLITWFVGLIHRVRWVAHSVRHGPISVLLIGTPFCLYGLRSIWRHLHHIDSSKKNLLGVFNSLCAPGLTFSYNWPNLPWLSSMQTGISEGNLNRIWHSIRNQKLKAIFLTIYNLLALFIN